MHQPKKIVYRLRVANQLIRYVWGVKGRLGLLRERSELLQLSDPLFDCDYFSELLDLLFENTLQRGM